ncbi:MAG: oligopeptide transporter, OPT family [Gammaproteobacteria bacterium]|nr:oligopeptide transporter, OPT family [Gammaproteobacteria bacterium]
MTQPQLTVKAVFLGIALAMLLASANAYLGLFAGMTVSASIPAAVISMGILKLFRNSNILENNIVQTAASAGESLAAGVIFTLPALIMLGYWETFDYWWVCMIAGLGGLLGVLFTVPLRRAFIVDQGLNYPEGRATAEVLKAGKNPEGGLKVLVLGGAIGAAVKLGEAGLKLWPSTAAAGTWVGNSTTLYIGSNLSPALLGVGYIVGLNVSALILIGGAISWYVAIPIYSTWFISSDPALATKLALDAGPVDMAFQIWTNKIRYLGVGAMLVGGLWALVSVKDSIVSGVRSGLNASSGDREDAPMRLVIAATLALTIPMLLLYQLIVGSFGIALAMTIIMAIAGFLFSAVAGYMAGIVGSSHNPISGITISTILLASLILLWLLGAEGIGVTAAIVTGAVVCCAAAIAGDNMQDLKAGHILGATPWKQQFMQCVGVVSSVLVMAPILNLLLKAYGIGLPTAAHPDALLAPQAALMASVANGVFTGNLPWGMIAAGAGIGSAIIVIDEILAAKKAAFRAPVLAVAIGIYLPIELAIPIFIGGFVSFLVTANKDAKGGMLLAAGLITGEALIGVLLAIPIVITGNTSFLAVPESWRMGNGFGLIMLTLVAARLYQTAKQK